MDEPELTQKDYDAGEDAVRLHGVADGLTREQTVKELARLHSLLGRDRFRLHYGLRKPRCCYEEWHYMHYHGKISEEEVIRLSDARATRPVDQEMIDTYYSHLIRLLKQYRRGMLAAAHTRNCPYLEPERRRLEREATKYLARTKKRSMLDDREIRTLLEHVVNVRIKKGLGNPALSKYSASTAIGLTWIVFARAIDSWKTYWRIAKESQEDPNLPFSAIAADLMFDDKGPQLPAPQSVLALLEQEQTAATAVLREMRKGDVHTQIVVQQAQIQVEQATVNAGQPRVGDSGTEQTSPLLTVSRWSEIAVGIDERRQYWAVCPAPRTGGPFPKNKAVTLDLRGGRWEPLFEALAKSVTGDRAPIVDIAVAFGIKAPPTDVDADGRARPGAIRNATLSELTSKGSAPRSQLNGILKELGGKFRKKIAGPAGKQDPCFGLDGDNVRSGFVVRYLLQLDNGTYSFGERAEREGG